MADKNALANYNKFGKKLVTGLDKEVKLMPSWILSKLDFEDS